APACFVFRLAARFFLGAVTSGLGGQALRFFGRLEPRTFASMHALNFFFDGPHAQFGATTQLFFLGPLARFRFPVAALVLSATGALLLFRLTKLSQFRLMRLLRGEHLRIDFGAARYFHLTRAL